MSRLKIQFFFEDISYTIKHKARVREWIADAIRDEAYELKQLNFIFCNDSYLLSINQSYLKHDTYTDIITFDNSEIKGEILGDIFISIDRIRENAKNFEVPETDELHRVMIHGTLHLLGYKDKTNREKVIMTKKEDFYLSMRLFKI